MLKMSFVILHLNKNPAENFHVWQRGDLKWIWLNLFMPFSFQTMVGLHKSANFLLVYFFSSLKTMAYLHQ